MYDEIFKFCLVGYFANKKIDEMFKYCATPIKNQLGADFDKVTG